MKNKQIMTTWTNKIDNIELVKFIKLDANVYDCYVVNYSKLIFQNNNSCT